MVNRSSVSRPLLNEAGRLVRRFYCEAIRRRLPHGLVNWRYLRPGRDERIRLHRRFWCKSRGRWPRTLWWILEAWLWTRWVLWAGWWASARVVRRLGPTVAAEEGLGLWQQYGRVLRLALAWCVSPAEIYRFRLYRQPMAVPDFVFSQETAAYHRWRSEPRGLTDASLALLQDKVALAERLAGIDIPVVATVRIIARGSSAAPLAGLMDGFDQVFCKRRSSNQGRNAFAAWRTADGLAGLAFTGQPLPDTHAVEDAWLKLLQSDDALIQPHLENHPALAPMTDGGQAITVRFITQWNEEALACLDATLEVPAGRDPDSGRARYVVLPLVPDSGELQPVPAHVLLPPEARARAESLYLNAPADRVPGWDKLVRASYCAHACFRDVQAIAWDWVVTPEGPALLEGNSGWGTTTPQMCCGGFLNAAIR